MWTSVTGVVPTGAHIHRWRLGFKQSSLGHIALAAIGLVLGDPVPQGLGVDVELFGQPADYRLRIRLLVQAHCPFAKL